MYFLWHFLDQNYARNELAADEFKEFLMQVDLGLSKLFQKNPQPPFKVFDVYDF